MAICNPIDPLGVPGQKPRFECRREVGTLDGPACSVAGALSVAIAGGVTLFTTPSITAKMLAVAQIPTNNFQTWRTVRASDGLSSFTQWS